MTVLRVANEFAEVFVEVVETRNGERLEIRSPRWGTSILLDSIALEAVSWQPAEVFSRMLECSIAPGRADGAREPMERER